MWKPTHVDVTVIKAKDLVVKGKGSNDVYAIIQLGKEKFQTTTREKTVSPEWNEECSFEIPSDMTTTIEISLFHRNLLSIDRFLGRIALPIDELFSFQEKPHAQWYALRAKTTKKKAKYRGEILVRTTFVFRSDALGGSSNGSGLQTNASAKGSTLTPLGSEFLRKSATNLALSLGASKKSSFRDKKSDEDKRSSVALADGDSASRQKLKRSNSLAALTVALRRASFKKTPKNKNEDEDEAEDRKNKTRESDDDDDQSESVASHARVDSDNEERDDFGTGSNHGIDDSTVMQRKQYSLPHTVGSANQQTPGGISRAQSSVSAGAPGTDRFLDREGSGRLKTSSKNSNQHNSTDSQVSAAGLGGGGSSMQRQPSARSSASESGLSIDARSQSSGVGFPGSYGNGTPPKSSTLQNMSSSAARASVNSSAVHSANTPSGPGSGGRFSTTNGMTPNTTVPAITTPNKGGSLRLHNENNNAGANHHHSSNNNSSSGGIALPSFSPRTSTTVIPSEVYAQYGRMSREELLQVIARQQVEIARRDEYIDEMLSRVMEKAHWILQKS